ncbi:uncharacterized protein LOC125303093 [Alosa alosa]|uniref:uncharacterized protein LOC121724350 n=1 Tax=Alosa sapidissima TaxID=34773 RepID=UPI001C0A0188|nr:uncharacterized protein LOC121724350 [Alosa sapidissima]XP_048112568.1 uncharacterized protein LOC125303093 [Alosa alosa]
MAPHCCVPQCTSSHRKKSYRGQTFHRFPKDQGLRRQWIINIRRDPGRNFKINTYTKVCSEHFLPDCLVKSRTGITKLKPGAVPTVFAWSSVRPEGRSVVRTASNVSTDLDDRHGVNVLSEEIPPPHPDHEYAALPPSLQDQLEEARKTIGDQELLILDLKQKQFLISNFQGDDKQISFYTGFPDYETFKAVFMALQPTAENMVGWSQAQRLKHTSGEVLRQGFSASKLSTMDQFFLFLCRLRQGFPEQDLATRFHVSQSTVSRVCVTWVNFLYFMLGSLPMWPSRKTVDELMPDCFKCTFPATRVILDCTEIHVQKLSSKVLNSAIHSHYKGNTKFKGLIGIAPSGEVTFVSELYTGSISDKEITKKSGILSVLEEGDMVMADKGFLIKDLLSERQVSLVIPPFLGPSGHFTADEVRKTQAIARLRIHVERAIRRIKEYHILDKVLPMTLVGSVNQLWSVCALLTNFQGPLF